MACLLFQADLKKLADVCVEMRQETLVHRLCDGYDELRDPQSK